jgi:acid phosphatase type 7
MRSLSRSAMVCSGLAALFWSAASEAAPKYVRLSYTGDTQTTMTVSWNTTVATASEVQLGTSSKSYSQIVSGTSIQANAGLGTIHEATLTGLSPSTTYYYIVGSTSDGFSQESSFTTGPVEDVSCGSVKFVFLADNRPDPIFGGGQNWPQIHGQSAAHNPAFTLNGGDLVIDGDKIDQWLAFLQNTEPVAKKIPFMPAIGNHDTGPGSGDTANYNQIFALPRSAGTGSSGTEDHYYFTYGNAIFVTLSTEGFKGGSIPFANQAAWLDEVLTNNPKKWKFVQYHKPTYTGELLISSLAHKPNEANQNAALVPVIDKHHVDIVFTSHNHWYERFEPSACATKGNPGSSKPCSVGASNFAGGTVYIVSGGAGAFTIPVCGSVSGLAKCSGDHHYVLVDVQNEKLTLQTWGAAPQANKIIDTIAITKAPDVCGSTPDAGAGGSGAEGGSAGSGSAGEPGSGGDSGSTSSGGSSAGGTAAGGASGGSDPGGSAGSTGGGAPGNGGTSTGGSKSAPAGDDSGCGCRVAGRAAPPSLLLGLLGLAALRRRRRQR